jgi:glutamate-1-semialdehyde 2,1-aminomutase
MMPWNDRGMIPSAELGGQMEHRNGRRSDELRRRLRELVPGGAHTYAKGDDQYPEHLAPIIERGRGSHVWDVDGNEYVEYGSGLRAVTLGHAEPRVVAAAATAMGNGTNFVRPSVVEVEAAETFVRVVGAGEMVKFAKNGSDATTAAVRLARAATGRDIVAICRDQPFFSVDDWFIGSTPMPAGVPGPFKELTVSFGYNDLPGVERLFLDLGDRLACLVLEPAGVQEPQPGYLGRLRELCDEHGTILIFDEMITGFRWHVRGAQEVYGVRPHLSCFGKALGNGYAIAALAGQRDLMELGGFDHDHERVFLLSTTHGAETHGLAASIEVMRIYEAEGVVERLRERGERLASRLRPEIERSGLGDRLLLLGHPSNLVFATLDASGQRSHAFRTLFLQEMIRRGVIGPSFVVSASLTDADIDHTVDAVGDVLRVYRRALDEGVERYLEGRPVKPVFRARA